MNISDKPITAFNELQAATMPTLAAQALARDLPPAPRLAAWETLCSRVAELHGGSWLALGRLEQAAILQAHKLNLAPLGFHTESKI